MHKFTLVIFPVFLTFLSTSSILAQRDSVRVRVFDSNGQDLQTPKVKHAYNDQNYFSWNLYLLGRGAFVLGYERVLHPKHSVNVDLGLTYRDFIYEGLKTETLDGGSAKTGHYVSAAYKFYPNEYNDFDGGLYLSPGIINRAYSVTIDAEYYDGTDTKTAQVDGSYSMTEYFFKMGYVRESAFFDDLITDIYIGVGSRSVTNHTYEVTSSSGIDEVVTMKETTRVPAFYLGLKIGFTF